MGAQQLKAAALAEQRRRVDAGITDDVAAVMPSEAPELSPAALVGKRLEICWGTYYVQDEDGQRKRVKMWCPAKVMRVADGAADLGRHAQPPPARSLLHQALLAQFRPAGAAAGGCAHGRHHLPEGNLPRLPPLGGRALFQHRALAGTAERRPFRSVRAAGLVRRRSARMLRQDADIVGYPDLNPEAGWRGFGIDRCGSEAGLLACNGPLQNTAGPCAKRCRVRPAAR